MDPSFYYRGTGLISGYRAYPTFRQHFFLVISYPMNPTFWRKLNPLKSPETGCLIPSIPMVNPFHDGKMSMKIAHWDLYLKKHVELVKLLCKSYSHQLMFPLVGYIHIHIHIHTHTHTYTYSYTHTYTYTYTHTHTYTYTYTHTYTYIDIYIHISHIYIYIHIYIYYITMKSILISIKSYINLSVADPVSPFRSLKGGLGEGWTARLWSVGVSAYLGGMSVAGNRSDVAWTIYLAYNLVYCPLLSIIPLLSINGSHWFTVPLVIIPMINHNPYMGLSENVGYIPNEIAI